MPGKSPVTYGDGTPIAPMQRVIVTLDGERTVAGRVMRVKVGPRRVTVALFDPVFRRADGYPCRIRRLCLPRRFVRLAGP